MEAPHVRRAQIEPDACGHSAQRTQQSKNKKKEKRMCNANNGNHRIGRCSLVLYSFVGLEKERQKKMNYRRDTIFFLSAPVRHSTAATAVGGDEANEKKAGGEAAKYAKG